MPHNILTKPDLIEKTQCFAGTCLRGQFYRGCILYTYDNSGWLEQSTDAPSILHTLSILGSIESTPSILESIESTPSILGSIESTPSILGSIESTPSLLGGYRECFVLRVLGILQHWRSKHFECWYVV